MSKARPLTVRWVERERERKRERETTRGVPWEKEKSIVYINQPDFCARYYYLFLHGG